MRLLCYLILALCCQIRSSNVPLSVFPSVQTVAQVGGEGLLKCHGPGVYNSFAVCLPHRSPVVNRRTHFSRSFALSVCLSLRPKTSNSVPLIFHASNLKPRASPTSQSFTERSRAKPLLSSCGQSAGRNYFIPSFFFLFLLPLVRLKLFTGLQWLACWLNSRAELRKAEQGQVEVR